VDCKQLGTRGGGRYALFQKMEVEICSLATRFERCVARKRTTFRRVFERLDHFNNLSTSGLFEKAMKPNGQ
jgi:hypothetical protein